ncbi:hypothetical protein [Pandoraea sp. NPDC090278]|uniref:hypothetical protein n=1 Tax=Pandoraea sp. NPDC090278 TaxID=3364391 RepID=UPI00383A3A75
MTDKPKANTPYRIMLGTAKILRADGDVRVLSRQVAEGVTDGKGHTGTLYLDREELDALSLVEKVGTGAYGTVFLLRSALGPAIRDWYEIQTCPGSVPYRGFSDQQGSTAYVTSDKPCKARLRVGHQYEPNSAQDSASARR